MKAKEKRMWRGCLFATGLFASMGLVAGEPDESGIGGTGHAAQGLPGAELPMGTELPPAAQMPFIVAPPMWVAPVTPEVPTVPATDMTGAPVTAPTVTTTPQP